MIGLILTLIASFVWLGYETDWMRVRLLCGKEQSLKEQPKRKWQFLKYGDDALQLCQQCQYGSRLTSWRSCGKDKEVWFGWRLPARTVRINGSTINFKEGCNLYRAKLLKDIAKAQKSKALPQYGNMKAPISYGPEQPYGDIQIKVDGEVKLNLNGDSKRGMVKDFMKQYCRPGKGKIRLVKVR